jgi:hypothetical protein
LQKGSGVWRGLGSRSKKEEAEGILWLPERVANMLWPALLPSWLAASAAQNWGVSLLRQGITSPVVVSLPSHCLCLFLSLSLAVLGFELRPSHLLGRHSTT